MLSILDLPPEIRLSIYKILLQFTLAKDTRILYFGHNPLRCGVAPDRLRHKQPFKRVGSQGIIGFLDTRSILATHVALSEYTIHLADIDDLLFLGSTCRLIRSELLPLAWSNADVQIHSPDNYKELHCIFYDRLTSESCNYIRTLQFNIDYSQWSPSETIKVVKLIRARLPQLEELIVTGNFCLGKGFFNPFAPGVAALRTLPSHIAVELRAYPGGKLTRSMQWNTVCTAAAARKDELKNAHLQYLRMEYESVCQRRREKLARKEQEDEVGDILEATVEMRSLMVD